MNIISIIGIILQLKKDIMRYQEYWKKYTFLQRKSQGSHILFHRSVTLKLGSKIWFWFFEITVLISSYQQNCFDKAIQDGEHEGVSS